jgi:hypothetical protein
MERFIESSVDQFTGSSTASVDKRHIIDRANDRLHRVDKRRIIDRTNERSIASDADERRMMEVGWIDAIDEADGREGIDDQ